MCNNTKQRVDEVSKYYKPVNGINVVLAILFWVSIFFALALLGLPYLVKLLGLPLLVLC